MPVNPVQIHYNQSSGESWVPEKRLWCWLFYGVNTENHKSIQHWALCSAQSQPRVLHCPMLLSKSWWAQSWVKPQGQISHLGYTEGSFTESEINTGIRCMCTHLDFGAIYEKHIIGWNIHIILWVLREKKVKGNARKEQMEQDEVEKYYCIQYCSHALKNSTVSLDCHSKLVH